MDLPSLCKQDAQLRRVLDAMFELSSYESANLKLDCGLLRTTGAKKGADTTTSTSKPIRRASTEPASRLSVLQLRHQLDLALADHQAKAFGLCPIRRDIYDQCFEHLDELIRQVTVNCVEQGLLLFRVRNELRTSLQSYRKLYESSVLFAISKTVEAELVVKRSRLKIAKLEELSKSLAENSKLSARSSFIREINETDALNRIEELHKVELKQRDEIIEQQQNIIKTLTTKLDEGYSNDDVKNSKLL